MKGGEGYRVEAATAHADADTATGKSVLCGEIVAKIDETKIVETLIEEIKRFK